ncbi:MAG: GNAT family N-acetyltransferase [Muribaculaceae bacterium]|nr:GNAT family N-acetyltransferase [Muribaculaceae bacterium]
MDTLITSIASQGASPFTLRRYTPADLPDWERLVESSRNATFLFHRPYMEYHSDRFADHSLIACKSGRPIALLPADLTADEEGRGVLRSHGGLTYGGWILPPRHLDATDMLHLFDQLRSYCRAEGIGSLHYKPLPYIYHRMPSQDDLYALFRQGARLAEANISCCIDLSRHPGLNNQQKRNLKRAILSGPEISEVTDTAGTCSFHHLLTDCLAERHDAAPVHSAAELSLLRERFPDRIRIFTVADACGVQGGVCIYDTGQVAHAQYICSTPAGRSQGLLTLLFSHLTDTFSHRRYFDFGTSNEDHGLILNQGLYRQKSSLGGSGVIYQRYIIDYD